MSEHYIYGRNSVLALLKADPDRVHKVLVADGLKPDKRIDAIYQAAKGAGVAIQRVPRRKLDNLLEAEAGNSEIIHQGILAAVAPKALLDIETLIRQLALRVKAGEYPRLLMLDEVTDPRNFGAILRIIDAAGWDGVIIGKLHSAGFGPAVAKSASGAEGTVDVAVVSNLAQGLKRLKEAGFWIVGAANDEKAVDYFQQDYKMPTVLVMGSEGKGLSRLVQKNCDFLVRIPMRGTVDSLNVAAATAVLVFHVNTPN